MIIQAIFRLAHDYIFVLFLYAALRLPPTMTSRANSMILKNPIFGVFEAKYLWKFLSISGKTYIIRIVSSRRIFEKKIAIMSYAL